MHANNFYLSDARNLQRKKKIGKNVRFMDMLSVLLNMKI